MFFLIMPLSAAVLQVSDFLLLHARWGSLIPSSPPELLLLATRTASDNSSCGGELGTKLGFARVLLLVLASLDCVCPHDCLTTPTSDNTHFNYAIVIHVCHMTLTTPTLDNTL